MDGEKLYWFCMPSGYFNGFSFVFLVDSLTKQCTGLGGGGEAGSHLLECRRRENGGSGCRSLQILSSVLSLKSIFSWTTMQG